MKIKPEISSRSIVLLGHFNPAIFYPAWLKAKDVEPSVDKSTVIINVVSEGVTNFTIGTETYFVDNDRYQISTTSCPWVRVADKTRNIFHDHLRHTPIYTVGINRDIHFDLGSFEARMRLGRNLAPIGPWGNFGNHLESKDRDLAGGFTSLTMLRKKKFNDQGIIATNRYH